jgi:hypothetical protein
LSPDGDHRICKAQQPIDHQIAGSRVKEFECVPAQVIAPAWGDALRDQYLPKKNEQPSYTTLKNEPFGSALNHVDRMQKDRRLLRFFVRIEFISTSSWGSGSRTREAAAMLPSAAFCASWPTW